MAPRLKGALLLARLSRITSIMSGRFTWKNENILITLHSHTVALSYGNYEWESVNTEYHKAD